MLSESRSIFAIGTSGLPVATGKVRTQQAARGPYPPPSLCKQTTTIPQRGFPIHAPIATVNGNRDDSKTRLQKGWAMNEQDERLARAREEIAARVASFKATQERFEREREEYYATTLGKAWSGFNRPSFWS